MKSAARFLATIGIFCTLASCGGGGGDGTYTAHQDKVYLVGSLSGELKEEIAQIFVVSTTYDGNSSDAPIIISADSLISMSSSGWSAVLSAFNNQHPIVLSNATQNQINTLLAKLNLKFQHDLPEGDSYAEVFAVDREPGGHIFVWSQSPPPPDSADSMASLSTAYHDNHDDQLRRTDNFRAWLALSQSRMSAALSSTMAANAKKAIARAAATSASSSSQNLLDFAQAYVQTQHYSLNGNNYQVSYYVYSCHAINTTDGSNSDWFYVSQRGILNSSGFYKGARRETVLGVADSGLWEAKWYARSYSMDSWIPSDANNWLSSSSSEAALQATSPDNANNITNLSTTIEQHIAGSVGFTGTKPSVSLSGGVDITNQSSFSVQDVTVDNDSGSKLSNAKWTYTFKRPEQTTETIGIVNLGKLSDPALLSYSAFQPNNQWVWQVRSAVRSQRPMLKFSTRLNVVLERAVGGTNHIVFFPPDAPQFLPYKADGNDFWAQVPLVYPPLISSPSDMSFGSQGQFQTATLAATGQWTASCDQTWCHIDPPSGVGSTTIHVTVDQNATDAARSATINFRSPDGLNSDTTKVFQSQYQ